MKKKIILLSISAILLFGALFLLEKLLIPKHVSGIVEGSLIESYYNEKLKHDILFIGDCEVYENFSPVTLWENYGYTSFIRGSAQQLIWQSYYLLEETFKYEKPDVVVFNVLAMKYDTPQKEAYNRMTLDGMAFSKSKLEAIKASMLPEEHMIDYIFPFLRYHSRWSSLTKDDFQYMFNKKPLFHNGYYMRVDVKPVEYIPKKKKLSNYEFGELSYEYLEMMTNLCKKNGVELVLIKSPTLYPVWYDEWDQQMIDYAKEHNLMYFNFIDHIEEAGIDFKTDTYDAGLHLNITGAEKMSLYFGEILKDQFDIVDRRNDPVYAEAWKEKSTFYYEMRDQQYYELETYGEIMMYGEVVK